MRKQTDERISKFLKTACEIPSLAGAVQQLVKLSDKQASPRDFAELIEKDQGLTAKVLRLVNSAFYSLRQAIGSPRQASALLGTKTLKSLVLSVSVANIFKKAVAGLEPIPFWRHSIATAVAAQRFARHVIPMFEEDLYVAGLFHDIGIALFAQHLSLDYAKVLKAAALPGGQLSSIEEECFGVSHAEMGWNLVSRWRLPSMVCDAIRYHETTEELWSLASPDNARGVSIVQLADAVAAHVGLDYMTGESSVEPLPAPPARLALDPGLVESVASGLVDEVMEKERALFPEEAVVAR